MCKWIYRVIAVLLFSVLFAQAATAKVDFYVSPSGDDSASGSRSRPFATLAGARDAIRELKEAGNLPEGGITVHIRGGVYPLTESFNLTARDSGAERSRIVYRWYKDEEVRLIGFERGASWWSPELHILRVGPVSVARLDLESCSMIGDGDGN